MKIAMQKSDLHICSKTGTPTPVVIDPVAAPTVFIDKKLVLTDGDIMPCTCSAIVEIKNVKIEGKSVVVHTDTIDGGPIIKTSMGTVFFGGK